MSIGRVSVRRHAAAGEKWVFVYEWFAGWRWERYRRGRLEDEALHSYQTVRECVEHARASGYRPPPGKPLRPSAKRVARAARQPTADAAPLQYTAGARL